MPGGTEGGWGLSFEPARPELEHQFQTTRTAAHQATTAVLSAGVALVHALLSMKLYSQSQYGLAAAAAATLAQQLLVWVLALLSPQLFSRLRPLLYALSVTFPAIQASPLLRGDGALAGCANPDGPALWVSLLLSTGVPWLVVHAVLFPLTVSQGLLVHGLAVLLLLPSNRQRCASALQQCPAASPLLRSVARWLQRLSVFSASPRSWLDAGGGGGAELELRSCVAVYSAVQVAVGYLAVLQLAWWLERAARLAFLRRTDEVEAEWRLERRRRPPGTLPLELAAMLLLAWQPVDLWMGAAADWAGRVGGGAAGGVA